MNIKRNIIFSLESRKKNGVPIVENVPIRMRVIFASQRIEFTTGYRIDAAKWDTDKQRVKLHQQAETERIRNQYRPAALLYGNTEHLQGVRGSGNHAYHRTSKGGFQQPAQRKEGGRTAETPDVRPYGGIRGVHQGMRDTERLV